MTPYAWIPPVCWDATSMFRWCHMFGCTPCMFECHLVFEYPHMFGYPCMFGCPHMFGHLHMFGYPPVCLDIPHMFALPICLDAPVCLGAHYLWTPLCMVGHPHIFGHPLYVWMSSICLASPCVFGCGYPNIWQCPNVLGASKINITKKACFVRLRGCPYAPIDLDDTICLDTTCMLGCHLYV